jgi:alpha-aminoadipate carrier protein LysW
MNPAELSAPCPVCDAVVTLSSSAVVSEVVSCGECGSDIEVKGLDPLELAEAPVEEEDWGE